MEVKVCVGNLSIIMYIFTTLEFPTQTLTNKSNYLYKHTEEYRVTLFLYTAEFQHESNIKTLLAGFPSGSRLGNTSLCSV